MSALTNERDASRMREMYENALIARQFMDGKIRDDLTHEIMLAYALVRALETIGKAANHVTDETKELLPSVEWRSITAMRNRIVHGYDNIDYDVVWDVVQNDLPPMISLLKPLLLD